MMRPVQRRFLSLVGLLWLAFAAAPLLADRLHLESGGRIDTDSWWIDGDWILYEGENGTVGIPRSAVIRIESGEPTESPGRISGWNAPDGQGRSAPRGLDAVDPTRLRDLLERGQAAIQQRDFDRASAYFLEAVNAAPDLHVARVGYAASEIALGRDGLALSVVQDGLARDPDQPQLLELLGDLRYREERVEDALVSWRRAFDLDPGDRLRDKILKAERELGASRDYDFAASSHFNLRYDGEIDVELASAVMEHLEEQYWVLSDRFRHAPPQPITVQLFPERQFRDVTQSAEWVGGLYDGKIRVPLGGLSRLHPRARQVLTHELTHAVVHSKTRGNCPRWLHEGLAQISEGRPLPRSERELIARRLASGNPAAWDEAGFSYPMALGLTRFLESIQGADSVVYLLQLLGEGASLDGALHTVYGRDYVELCRDWARAAREEAGR
jgi:tetratricopeptide (TPR) repeat protein